MIGNLDDRQRQALINAATGKESPDLLIRNARLVNVYTGEVEEGVNVGIKGDRIALATQEEVTPGTEAMVVEAGGSFLLPGFIEGHTHLDTLQHIHEYLRYAACGGTTTIITETSGIATVVGTRGVYWLLDAMREQPIRVLATSPAVMPGSPKVQEGYIVTLEDLKQILAEPEMVGMGEIYCWPRVTDGDEEIMPLLGEAARQGKAIEGHSAGCRGRKLQGYIAAGVTSCHEPITADEARERLRLGLHVMLREGTIRKDLAAMAPLAGDRIDPRRLALVTDGVEPWELMEKGYMEHVVQKAIDIGFDPVTAIRMATLNVTEHFHLDWDLGGIAPGKSADMLLVPHLNQIKAKLVIARGRIIAENGRLVVPVRQHRYPLEAYHAVTLPSNVTPETFKVDAGPYRRKAQVRVIHQVNDMLTKEETAFLPVEKGEILADPERDLIKACACSTMDGTSHATAFVSGFGLRAGACACSYTWDVPNVMVVGASDHDMAVALNRIAKLGGGLVAVRQGQIVAELPLPIAGIISEAPLEEVARQLQAFTAAVKDMGYPHANPFLSLQVLTTMAVPFLRLSHLGLARVREQELVSLVTSGE